MQFIFKLDSEQNKVSYEIINLCKYSELTDYI